MTKGRDYYESTGNGDRGVIALLPRRLIRDLSIEEAAECPVADDSSEHFEMYERFIVGSECLKIVPVEDALALRMGEGVGTIYWLPRPGGALAVQWQGAESEEALLEFALNHAGAEEWDEEITFDTGDGLFFLCELLEALFGDEPLCEVALPPGQFRVTAKWLEDQSVTAILFKFTRIS